jgi:hypothetical protein
MFWRQPRTTHDTVPLRDYFDQRIDEIARVTALTAAAMDKRLEGMNEFREQLNTQAKSFYLRQEHDSFAERITGDIRLLRESKANLEGKASQLSVSIAILIAGLGVVISLVNLASSLSTKEDTRLSREEHAYIERSQQKEKSE